MLRPVSSEVCSSLLIKVIGLAFFLLPLIAWSPGNAALAQVPKKQSKQQASLEPRKYNDNTLMILGGHMGTTYFRLARDIAAALGARSGLRLLAVDAAGGSDNVRDLLFLRGIDLALVPGNALAYANATASFGPGLQQRLNYITQLYSEEVHILVGPAINSFQDLRGRKIAVPPEDGNSEFTAQDLLRSLGIQAEVIKVAAPDAIDDVRSGTFAALLLLGGKPLRFVSGLPKDGSIHLLALPSNSGLDADAGYSPAAFRSDDYPALIPDGKTIDAVSVNAVVLAKNTAKSDEANRRISKFVPEFFGALTELAGPQWNPKWAEVNLAGNLAGWSRFAAAREWLDRSKLEQAALVQRSFEEFLSAARPPGSPALSPKVRKELFERFVTWSRNSISTHDQPIRP